MAETHSRSEVLKASPPMFRTAWLDRLSRVHPAVPVVLFVPAIGILASFAFARLATVTAVALIALGYGFWTLAEYWIHRAIFHFEPVDGFGARLHWIIHGVHHDHPNDPLRLVMPPSVSIPLSSLFCVGFRAVLGTPRWYAFAAGFVAGYLLYDMTHYYLHHVTPTSGVGRRLREAHMRHHFQDDHTAFGVSAPYWDRVFGTAPQRRRR